MTLTGSDIGHWAVKRAVPVGNGYLGGPWGAVDVIYLNFNKAFDSLPLYPGC